MTHLAGKTALVTGGSRGIGAAIVRRRGAGGVHVAISYTNARAQAEGLGSEIVAKGGKAFAIQADMGKLEDIGAMFAACDHEFGEDAGWVTGQIIEASGGLSI
jgi:3-oxoacyl-[acyl-carrier protein] reductase